MMKERELNENRKKLKDKMVEVAMLLADLSEGRDCIYTSVDVETEIPDKEKKTGHAFQF